MSFETIGITHRLSIINGFVMLPNNLEKDKTAVSLAAYLAAFPNATIGKLSAGTGGARLAGSKHGIQEFIELSTSAIDCCEVEPSNSESQCAKVIFRTTRATDNEISIDTCYVPTGYTEYPHSPEDPDTPYTPPGDYTPCVCPEDFTAPKGRYYGISILFTIPSTMINSACMCNNGVDLEAGTYFITQMANDSGSLICTWTAVIGDRDPYIITIWYDTAYCMWLATITCGNGTVWSGQLSSDAPDGIWTTTGGCGAEWLGTIATMMTDQMPG